MLPFKSGFKSFEIAANGRPRSFWEASMEVGVFYAHRWLIRGVMYSSAVRNRRSVSGTDCGPSFARFGSAMRGVCYCSTVSVVVFSLWVIVSCALVAYRKRRHHILLNNCQGLFEAVTASVALLSNTQSSRKRISRSKDHNDVSQQSPNGMGSKVSGYSSASHSRSRDERASCRHVPLS